MFWVRNTACVICLLVLLLPLSILFASSYEVNKLKRLQDSTLDQFASKLAQEHGMKLLLSGSGDFVNGTGRIVDVKHIRSGFSFIDDRLATIDQARPMVVSMLKGFKQKLNEDPLFKNYMLYDDEKLTYFDYAFAMKICYWDQNNDRPLAPSLSQVRVAEDKITYYYASPKDQSLQLVHSESIAEAFKIVSNLECPPL